MPKQSKNKSFEVLSSGDEVSSPTNIKIRKIDQNIPKDHSVEEEEDSYNYVESDDAFANFVNNSNEFAEESIKSKDLILYKPYRILNMRRYSSRFSKDKDALLGEFEKNIYFFPQRLSDLILEKYFAADAKKIHFKNLNFVICGSNEKDKITYFKYKLITGIFDDDYRLPVEEATECAVFSE